MKTLAQRINIFSKEIRLSDSNLKVAEEHVNNVRKVCSSSLAAILDLNVLHTPKYDGVPNQDPWKNSQFWKSGEQINQQLELIEDTDSPVRQVMEQIGQLTQKIAKHHHQFEAKVQTEICQGGEIGKVLEGSQLSIKEEKEFLQKKMREYANVKQRYNNTMNRSKKSADDPEFSDRLQPKERKLRDETYTLEKAVAEAESRLAQRLYSSYANENEYANNLAEYVYSFKTLLDDTLKEVEECLPKINKTLSTTIHRKVFGVSLDTHLSTNKVKIAIPLKIAALELLNHLKVEGLFRVNPDVNQLKRYKAAIDAGFQDENKFKKDTQDPHILASVIKSYLRELPEPLLGSDNFKDWTAASSIKDEEKRIIKIAEILQSLPNCNRTNIGFMTQFLARVSNYEKYNKMSVDNLVIVLGPNLIWDKMSNDKNPMKSVKQAIISLIKHNKTFFSTNYLEESKFKYYSFKSVDNENLSKGEMRKSKKLIKEPFNPLSGIVHENGTQMRGHRQSKGLQRQNTRRFSSPAPRPVLRCTSSDAQEKVEKRMQRSSRGRAWDAGSLEQVNEIIDSSRVYPGSIKRQNTTGDDLAEAVKEFDMQNIEHDSVDGRNNMKSYLDVDGLEEKRGRSGSLYELNTLSKNESFRHSSPGRLESVRHMEQKKVHFAEKRKASTRRSNTVRSTALMELDMWSSYLEDLAEEDPLLETCYEDNPEKIDIWQYL